MTRSLPSRANAGYGTRPSALAAVLPSIQIEHASEVLLIVVLSLLRQMYSPDSIKLALMSARDQSDAFGIPRADFMAIVERLLEYKGANRSPIEGMF
jgi:hypothetical protein